MVSMAVTDKIDSLKTDLLRETGLTDISVTGTGPTDSSKSDSLVER